MLDDRRVVTFQHKFAIPPERIIKRRIVVRAGVHLEAHYQVRSSLGAEVIFKRPPHVIRLAVIEQLAAVGVEAEGYAVGVSHVFRAHRGCTAQQDACGRRWQTEDKLLEGDAGAIAPGGVQQERPLAILCAERLARHAGVLLKEVRPAHGKLLLGLTAVSVANGIDSQLVEIHHRGVRCYCRLRGSSGDQHGGTPGGQRQADRFHAIPVQPMPTSKPRQDRRDVRSREPESNVALRSHEGGFEVA